MPSSMPRKSSSVRFERAPKAGNGSSKEEMNCGPRSSRPWLRRLVSFRSRTSLLTRKWVPTTPTPMSIGDRNRSQIKSQGSWGTFPASTAFRRSLLPNRCRSYPKAPKDGSPVPRSRLWPSCSSRRSPTQPSATAEP